MALENKSYVPTLAVRPSEMNGLEFLPGAAKDRMTPCFLLAPWANSSTLERTLVRIDRAFPNRPFILDIDRDYQITNQESEPQLQLERLKDSTGSFSNWVDFVREHDAVLPCLQTRNLSEIEIRRQIEAFQALGRPYCARIYRERFPSNFPDIVRALASSGSADFGIILEGGWVSDPLSLSAWFAGVISASLTSIDATIPVVISCTSIPNMFTEFGGRTPSIVNFNNRTLVDQVARSTNRQRIIYGDWGSTRPRAESGFASRPLDRIDYPAENSWLIARNKDENWNFRDAALAIVASPQWNGSLGIWGEEMITNTTINQALGIDTPQKNVASRVNVHLYRQTFYGQPPLPPAALDEEWED
ncbi:beta family protein [Methylobacterium sp. Leaf399]|uniref:beta family protein n=1 Tax=Methylobacterium sp. Leaf399 TaxID=1736364 RepID=UPI0009E77ACA|nr:beta family protein [Methylobacterium sp. Leaf399]